LEKLITNSVDNIEVKRGHWLFKLPYFNRFAAMTINPYIYINPKRLDPDAIPVQLMAHETIHITQQQQEGSFTIYLMKYLGKWVQNVFKYGFTMKAYFAIDWEVEAYCTVTPGYLTYLGHEDLERAYNESKS
jgi:hypothetical protein